jgi:cytochrome c-type biogenesis protein CcmH
MEDRVRVIASSLRCPVCQSLSVADSPSGVAREMRETIARRLRAGDTPSQIQQGFVDSYGDWILLAPPRRGINWLVWLVPPLIVVGGLIVALRLSRRWVIARDTEAGTDELPPEDRELLDRALEATEFEPR